MQSDGLVPVSDTKRTCKTNIDHVVYLKDAYQSGSSSWSNEKKSAFAKDSRKTLVLDRKTRVVADVNRKQRLLWESADVAP